MKLWIIYALLSAVCAALVAVFGKLGVEKVDTTLATTVRAIIMAWFLVAAALVQKKFAAISEINSRAWGFIVLSGLAGAVSWLFYFLALKRGPASGVAALDRLSVVIVFVLALIFLGEKFTIKAGIGAALIVMGAVLMVSQK